MASSKINGLNGSHHGNLSLADLLARGEAGGAAGAQPDIVEEKVPKRGDNYSRILTLRMHGLLA